MTNDNNKMKKIHNLGQFIPRRSSAIEDEVNIFNGIECADQNSDPLYWWKVHGAKLPILSRVA